MKKVALVTGSTSGIGKANVELLLNKGVNVIGIARTEEKKNRLLLELKNHMKDCELDILIGDLGDKKKINQLIRDIEDLVKSKYDGRIDILMNVAGIVSSGLHLNDDGNEVTFATNHLAVQMLTTSLTPYLEKSIDPRILVVSSLSHYRATINFNNIQNKKFYNILKAYQRSKLYNVFFVKAFANKYPNLPIFAIDPGLVKTEIGIKNTTKLAATIWKARVSKGTDAYYPAKFMVSIALEKQYLKDSGHYFKEGILKKSNPITYRMDLANRLWDYTEKISQES